MDDRTLYVYDTAGKEHSILMKAEWEMTGKILVVTDQANKIHYFNTANVVRWVVK